MPLKYRDQIKKTKMLIHWKSLITFGLLFWFLLCITDILGGHPRGYLYNVEDYDLLYETIFMERMQKSGSIMLKLKHFGALLLLWNFATFICSMAVCQAAKSCWWLLFNIKFRKDFFMGNNAVRSASSSVSKIPVKIKPQPLTDLQLVDLKKRLALKADISCPNFLRQRTSSTLSDETSKNSPQCHTLFKNSKMFVRTKEKHFEGFLNTRQIAKLRSEIMRLQNKSSKEQSELSRKIDIVSKEKRDVMKQLTAIQKENKAAKLQIEEMQQEKIALLKKLETATKEIKSNTKSKKAAFSKLEELSLHADKLKQELEQVSRDKDILENKLKVLQGEYEKLQERIIIPNGINFCEDYHLNTPERDTNNQNIINSQSVDKIENNLDAVQHNNDKNEPQSVTQTELDMKNIQVKIKQLEKNLENFNSQKTDFNFQVAHQGDSELTLNIGDSKVMFEEETDSYDYYFPNVTPRLSYWPGRAGDVLSFRPSLVLVDTNQPASVIQTIASKVNEKVRFLDNIRERCETEIDEYSSHESLDDIRIPRKIVSSSAAFQNFLRNLQPDSSRLPYDSQSECCF